MMGLKNAFYWLLIVGGLALAWYLLDLPPEAELIIIIRGWLETYGTVMVLVGSLLESLLLVGLYFPGSLVIFLSVGLATSPLHALTQVIAVSVGMFTGYLTNYYIGRYGLYKLVLRFGLRENLTTATTKLEQGATRYVFYTYWNPGLAAFTATAAGITGLPLRRFLMLSIGGIVVWNTFWGLLVYGLGEHATNLISFSVIIKLLLAWIAFELVRTWYQRRYGKNEIK
jgi:membrane protein DedA with SNARE-associated domain